MRTLLFTFFILCSSITFGQNYQCLQSGVKHYFTNSAGYLRGMRIDSVKTSGDTTVYYPFHTIRGNYQVYHTSPSAILDTNGASWLGKKVVQLNDGTFLFDNIWQDTVMIKTQAHTGESWIFYNDSTTRYYRAYLVAEDTMTVLGALDSVKAINITAYDTAGIDTTDPVNNFKIIISKNNGFVNIFDLYTFPYHKPDTIFAAGIDYYLDYIVGSLDYPNTPDSANSTFTLINFVNPTRQQLYDWNIGDVFENSFFNADYENDGTYPYGFNFDSITNKIISAGSTTYSFSGWLAVQHFPFPFAYINPTLRYPYDTMSIESSFTVTNDLLFDTSIMPEEKNQPFLQFYFPADSHNCLSSALYRQINTTLLNPYFLYFSEGTPLVETYKTGIGLVYYDWNVLEGDPPLIQDTTLLYYKRSGTSCGYYQFPSPIYNPLAVPILQLSAVSVYPNPASYEIIIQTNIAQPYTITLFNMLGQSILTTKAITQQKTISLSNIPAGVYNLSISTETEHINSKVIIEH